MNILLAIAALTFFTQPSPANGTTAETTDSQRAVNLANRYSENIKRIEELNKVLRVAKENPDAAAGHNTASLRQEIAQLKSRNDGIASSLSKIAPERIRQNADRLKEINSQIETTAADSSAYTVLLKEKDLLDKENEVLNAALQALPKFGRLMKLFH
jgi:hypothetical protein